MSDEASVLDGSAELDEQQQQESSEGNSGAGEQSNEPFLKVNERSVYRTREDAVRAYDEAGKRIAGLSRWEKEAQQWGLKDPNDLNGVFSDYLKLKQAAEAAAKTPQQKQEGSELTPEQKKAREWLKKEAEALGYTSKEGVEAMLKDMREELAALKGSTTQLSEQRLANQEAEARDHLASWLKEAKIDDPDGSKRSDVEDLISAWVNRDEERIARWQKGGVDARNLVREGYDAVLKRLGWQASTQSSNYAVDKGKSVTTNKKLPAPGTAGKKGASEQASPNERKTWENIHDKAYEAFEGVINSRK